MSFHYATATAHYSAATAHYSAALAHYNAAPAHYTVPAASYDVPTARSRIRSFVSHDRSTDLSARSGRKHKAWGVNPRIAWIDFVLSPRGGRQALVETAAARSAGSLTFFDAYLEFRFASPEALCCRLLRRLAEQSNDD
jgi:hypothetical protein